MLSLRLSRLSPALVGLLRNLQGKAARARPSVRGRNLLCGRVFGSLGSSGALHRPLPPFLLAACECARVRRRQTAEHRLLVTLLPLLFASLRTGLTKLFFILWSCTILNYLSSLSLLPALLFPFPPFFFLFWIPPCCHTGVVQRGAGDRHPGTCHSWDGEGQTQSRKL